MNHCVLFAELGPNPAALAELLWALARQCDLGVRAAFLLTSPRGAGYLADEFLAPGMAYDQLEAALGEALVRRENVHVTVVRGAASEAGDDERSADDAALWNEARWQNARAAMTAARDVPLYFALAGGRRRTSRTITTVVFQLMARARDALVDVRVGDRRVEGARAGFWFPEQRAQRLHVEGSPLLARDVAVHLVDVQVPRLRRLLGGGDFASWSDALAAGQSAVEAVPAVSLAVDFHRSAITVNGEPVKLSQAQFVCLAALALARLRGDEGWLRSDDFDTPRAVLERMRASHPARWEPGALAWKKLLHGTFDFSDEVEGAARVSSYRSSANARFKRALTATSLAPAAQRAAWPVCEVRSESRHNVTSKFTVWRLPVDADNITLR